MTWAVVWFARPASRTASSKQPHAYVGPVAAVSSRSVATSHAATCPTPPNSHTHRECRFHPPTHPNSRRPNTPPDLQIARPCWRGRAHASGCARWARATRGRTCACANTHEPVHSGRAMGQCPGAPDVLGGASQLQAVPMLLVLRAQPPAIGQEAGSARRPLACIDGGQARRSFTGSADWAAGKKGNLPHPKRSCSA